MFVMRTQTEGLLKLSEAVRYSWRFSLSVRVTRKNKHDTSFVDSKREHRESEKGEEQVGLI